MEFKKLALYLSQLEQTSSSNEMISETATFIQMLEPNEVIQAMYLVLGRLGPLHENIEFNISEKLVIRSIAIAFEKQPQDVVKLFKQEGDLGNVAETLALEIKSRLTVLEVYEKLLVLAQLSGKGSVDEKINTLAVLFQEMNPLECKYVTRIILERLRTGLAEAKILDALSVSLTGDKSLRSEIERAYNVFPDIGRVAQIVLTEGQSGLSLITVTPGIPIRPAKSERLPTPEKIVQKLEEFVVEPKMDGFRVQVHVFGKGSNRSVRLFSRNLNETTHMFPEIVEATKLLPIADGMFDSEALAYNPDTSEFLPFQDTVKRRRKHGIEEMKVRVPLKVFLFDILYLNGKDLLNTPASERFTLLQSIDYSNQSVLEVTRHDVVHDEEKLRKLFDLYVSEGLEGVMCKKLDAVYQAGSRNFNWVKYKRATEQALNDTVDVVVLGYYVGQGQRNKFGIGAFLVGVYDEASGTFQSLAKVGTGLTDDQWRSIKKNLDMFRTDTKPANYDIHQNLSPDFWVLPRVVVEIGADEITRSPIHTAAKGLSTPDNESGLALRFPRLIKIREDRDPFDTTTPQELVSMFQN